MSGDPGPTVRRRQLGAALRSFRVQAGLTVTEAAARMLVNASKISRIETAQRNASLRDVRDLCEIYAVPSETRERLMELARESRQREWWYESNLDNASATLFGLEGTARSIREYEPLLIPGLLQTPDYMRAVVEAYFDGDAEPTRRVVEARLKRQEKFDRERPPGLNIVLDEAVVRRLVGGRAAMQKQILYLGEQIDRLSAQLRIIPFSAGAHVGVLNGFVILELDHPAPSLTEVIVPSVVYVETWSGNVYYDQAEDVDRHARAFESLCRAALTPEQSRDYLRQVMSEL